MRNFIIVLFVIGLGMTASACQKAEQKPACNCGCTKD